MTNDDHTHVPVDNVTNDDPSHMPCDNVINDDPTHVSSDNITKKSAGTNLGLHFWVGACLTLHIF